MGQEGHPLCKAALRGIDISHHIGAYDVFIPTDPEIRKIDLRIPPYIASGMCLHLLPSSSAPGCPLVKGKGMYSFVQRGDSFGPF